MTIAEFNAKIAEAKSAQNAKQLAAGVVSDRQGEVTAAQAALTTAQTSLDEATSLAADKLAEAQAAIVAFVNAPPEIIVIP